MPDKIILILGGTKEAAEIAARLSIRPGLGVITALAGRTKEPAPLSGEVRTGGFGGADGLAAYLTEHRIGLLIDATHPFAATMSANARLAASSTGTRLIRLERPPWQAEADDLWTTVRTLEDAARALPAHARVLLALGSQHIAIFETRPDCHFVVRMVDAPTQRLPLVSHDLILSKPSADPAAEAELLRQHAITHIVCRNSGGSGAYAKIIAARQMHIPVVMVGKQGMASGDSVDSVEAVIALT